MSEYGLSVTWKGQRYLLIGDLIEGGAIATRAQYQTGEISEAHLQPDGTIRRYGKVIGQRRDLKNPRKTRLPTPDEEAGIMFAFNMLDYFCDGPPE